MQVSLLLLSHSGGTMLGMKSILNLGSYTQGSYRYDYDCEILGQSERTKTRAPFRAWQELTQS